MGLRNILKRATSIEVIRKAISIAKYEGFGSLFKKVRTKLQGSKEFSEAIIRSEQEKFSTVSIVIPVYNACQFTLDCLESIYSVKNSIDFEVIVVDNGSSDDTPALMAQQRQLRHNFSYFRQEKNLGFSGGVNQGISHSRGKYILILNNDTKVSDYWLDKLVAHAEQNPEIGIISPVTNYVGQGPQLDEGAKALQIDQINTYAAKIRERKLEYEPQRLVFFCVLLRRAMVDLIGLLDEYYIKGNFEDDDYCLRAILSGYKLAIARDSFVYHHGSITFHKNLIPHTSHMEENRRKFYEKVQRISVSTRFYSNPVNEPAISLVVRTVDRPALLTRALASLGNQTCKNFEVIIVNDGGDDVQSLVDQYDKHFPITYIRNLQPTGRTRAINIGVRNAKYGWIGFLDDDDILYPWHTAVFSQAIKLTPEEQFFYSDCNRAFFKRASDCEPFLTMAVKPWAYNKEEIWVSNRIPIHTYLIQSACIKQAGPFDESLEMLEDFEFLVRLSNFTSFTHVNAVTCEYRFYLDGINSMIYQREKIYNALMQIYKIHQSRDADVLKKREIELEIVRNEVEKIGILRKEIELQPEKKDIIDREIASLVLGFK